ncbi:hypothetical protein FDA09_11795 [Clostridium botulinum]|uniref:hypothetical protein n=1 Tax=Clostridium botulinum TaxID=1491 RepID=UPI000772E5B3|nr:hypothetical protein [Clostridium botulinum]NFF80434.1 hypothetical protein [Clostridium botulinum]NFH80833.1 hypothetical protein [Clostridium botulinum]NFH83210.1 hypothetical protein [Clostridium botulinum]NFI12075.1 hypothetical protein [Clostridium botulinum]NFI15776.1 hypothetical protein [Clostridium botulinum]
MKIKVPNIEFNSFSDGLCDIYSEDEDGKKTYKYRTLGFDNRVLGFGRYYAAKAAQVKTNAVVRIPKVIGVGTHDTVEIIGMGKYDIELIQNIFDSNPKSMDLTLRQLEMFEVKNE